MKALLLAALVLWGFAGQARDKAVWITAPGRKAPVAEQGLALQFRREIILPARPRSFPIRVSADSRFALYVNGERVATGPSRGDLGHWRYEAVDLAPFLKRGSNLVAAEVWNDDSSAPLAQITTGKTALLVEAEEEADRSAIDTGPSWCVRVDSSRTVMSARRQLRELHVGGFYAAGAPETIDATRQQPDWNISVKRTEEWQSAVPAGPGGILPITLVRDELPPQRVREIPSGTVARAEGLETGGFPASSITIPADSDVKFLVDAGKVVSAYPVLMTSGGRGAEISLTYTEALYDASKEDVRRAMAGLVSDERPPALSRVWDRSQVEGGVALGLTDNFKPDGGAHRRFEPFWWRSWRFVEIHVKTGQEPVALDSFRTFSTGYPFDPVGRFVSDDQELNEIWRVGWNTALLDAHETYMDTAYWEQLQYIGDTRLQMLISYAVAGDPRLAVQALDAFDQSRIVEGIPQSAYPSITRNPIPPFALLWIGSLHDFWMREPDQAVLKRTLAGMHSVLEWYAPYLRDHGVLRMTPGWLFVDWRPTLSEMNPHDEQRPDSCVITMLYYGALKDAADLEEAVGSSAQGRRDRDQAAKVREGLISQCWAADRGLFADTPAKSGFSQHANALAVLYDLVPTGGARDVLDRITLPSGGLEAPDGIIPVTYYFAHYLAEAFDHAGLADRYLAMLKPWREMVERHFTTFPENPDPSRSDSHAWSAHPTFGLLTYVAGIHPAAPGFGEVLVEPHLGPLATLDAAMAHPAGLIEARYSTRAGRVSAAVILPHGIGGRFVWKGRTLPLHDGLNQLELE